MGDDGGFYWTVHQGAAFKRDFNNAAAGATDPNLRNGFLSFFDATGGSRPVVQFGIDPDFYSRADIYINFIGETDHTGGLGLTLARKTGNNNTLTLEGKTYQVYEYTLSAAQATALGVDSWGFTDDEVQWDLKESATGNDVNFNPDEVQFSSGTGYVAPSGGRDADVSSGWYSLWPTQGNTAPIASTSSGNRANSRILTEDVREVGDLRIKMSTNIGRERYFTEIPASEVVVDSAFAFRYRGDTGGQLMHFQFRVLATNENPSIVVKSGASAPWNLVDVLTKIV